MEKLRERNTYIQSFTPPKCHNCILINANVLGATSIVKIGEVRLSDEIGGGIRDF